MQLGLARFDQMWIIGEVSEEIILSAEGVESFLVLFQNPAMIMFVPMQSVNTLDPRKQQLGFSQTMIFLGINNIQLPDTSLVALISHDSNEPIAEGYRNSLSHYKSQVFRPIH